VSDQIPLFGDKPEVYRKGAVLSTCGTYRYSLTRAWPNGSGRCVWVMLNPSKADAADDDPTIRRCVDFSQRWGFSSLEVVNLFAYRETDPKALFSAANSGVDIDGPENETALFEAILRASRIVVAWGNGGTFRNKGAQMIAWLPRGALCFRMTAQGQPEHPLYQRKDAVLVPATAP
jgi:hypothetical protein